MSKYKQNKKGELMKSFSIKLLSVIIIFTFVTIITFNSCSKDHSAVESEQMVQQATDDAAEVVTSSLASTNVGAMDQVEDVLQIASPTGFNSSSNDIITNFIKGNKQVTKEYDSVNGWWTVTVIKQRGISGGLHFANYTNVYNVQYLNKNGQFQKQYLTSDNNGGYDTAYTINHKILSGSGSLVTPRLTHHLLSLTAEWTVTNANTPNVTINTVVTKPYTRITSDTISKAAFTRTLNSQLTLNFTDVTGPRGSGLNWHNKTSGTITGTYHADVTRQKGEQYREKIIDRNISITLGQGSTATLDLNGCKYKFHMETGYIFH